MAKRYGTGGVKSRGQQVQVRLVSQTLGHPVQVKLSENEKEALLKAAQEHTPEGHLSTFLRDLALEAASHLHQKALEHVGVDLAARWVIEHAATECAMLPGEYMRFVALEAIGYTQATEIVARAKLVLEQGLLKAQTP